MKGSHYATTFLLVVFVLVLNVVSFTRTEWFITSRQVAGVRLISRYGLTRRCSYVHLSTPTGIEYNDFQCRPFPTEEDDGCDDKSNRYFCNMWKSAAYVHLLAIQLASVTLIVIFGAVFTESSRRRSWKLIANLIFLNALCQIYTFGIITDLWRTSDYRPLENAEIGDAYIMGTASWIIATILTAAVAATGIAANQGQTWAAGSYSYRPIP